jgi:hypothetical protein
MRTVGMQTQPSYRILIYSNKTNRKYEKSKRKQRKKA